MSLSKYVNIYIFTEIDIYSRCIFNKFFPKLFVFVVTDVVVGTPDFITEFC